MEENVSRGGLGSRLLACELGGEWGLLDGSRGGLRRWPTCQRRRKLKIEDEGRIVGGWEAEGSF